MTVEVATEKRLKICWGADYCGTANAYGYTVHNRMMKQYLSKIVVFDPDADIAITIMNADKFNRIIGKKNFLFTMFETPDLPKSYIEGIAKADHLIVPCTWLKGIFKKYTDKPVDVCREGVEVDKFIFKDRFSPLFRQRFRFLWVGAPNPRKGYFSVAEICKVIAQRPNIEMYIKTTMPNVDWNDVKQKILQNKNKLLKHKRGKIVIEKVLKGNYQDLGNKVFRKGPYQNIIVDTRNLSLNELIELYHSAHAFILPTTGEGFGLTLAEAMATGLPCIATEYSGTTDFFDDDVGYTIRYSMQEIKLKNYDLKTKCAIPDTQHLLNQMLYVFYNYNRALRKGKRAAERIRNKFTWPLAAKRLVEIIQNSGDDK